MTLYSFYEAKSNITDVNLDQELPLNPRSILDVPSLPLDWYGFAVQLLKLALNYVDDRVKLLWRRIRQYTVGSMSLRFLFRCSRFVEMEQHVPIAHWIAN